MDEDISSSDDELDQTSECQWQKAYVYNKYIPYYDTLCTEANSHLAQIKAGMGRSILLHEMQPGMYHWVDQLRTYTHHYGKRFTKEDHVRFIHTLYQTVVMPGQDLILLLAASDTMCSLLSERHLLSREDLILDWRPLYELYNYFVFKNFEEDGLICLPGQLKDSLKKMVSLCSTYFSNESTVAILEEARPFMCPWDMYFLRAFGVYNLFLPTTVDPAQGFRLFLDELMTWWTKFRNSPPWEEVIVEVFTRIAKDNIGLVDWNPYLDLIFTRFFRSLGLTIGGSSNGIGVGSTTKNMSVDSACLWIASMLGGNCKAQAYVQRLFQALESYYYPSNAANDKCMRLLYCLPLAVCQRVHSERYRKPDWVMKRVPESAKLSDQDLEGFVSAVLPCALNAMFMKAKQEEATGCIRFLSNLCPKLVVPPIMERMLSSTETLVEPHRLLQSMNATIAVILPLVREPEHRPHVIPLLNSLMPAFDLNDMVKCKIACQILSLCALMVPMVDCSEAVHELDDLTESEKELCSATANFEGIVDQVFERIFEIISIFGHNVSAQHRAKDRLRMNMEEVTVKAGFASVARAIVNNCSESIYMVVLNKVYSFVADNLFDNRVASEVSGELCWAVIKGNPEVALEKFLPYLFGKLQNYITEETVQEEEVNETVIWYLTLSSHVVRADGVYLLKYKQQIMNVLDLVLRMKCKEAYQIACRLLERALCWLTTIYVKPACETERKKWDSGFKSYLPIRHWGDVCGRNEEVKVNWHVPNDDEKAFADAILKKVLVAQLEKLNKPENMSRDELLQTLSITRACVLGAAAMFPVLPGPCLTMTPSRVDQFRDVVSIDPGGSELSFNGKNYRVVIHSAIKKALAYTLQHRSDDTKSLCHMAKDFHVLHIYRGYYDTRLNEQSKAIQRAKKMLVDKTKGKRSYVQPLVEEICVFHHLRRAHHRPPFYFTEIHRDMMHDLVQLATSHYGEVRRTAQEVLQVMFGTYQYSFRQVIDKVIYYLKPDPAISHDQLKGALYILLSGKRPILPRDFAHLRTIWTALIDAQHDQKPSIVMLIDVIMVGVVEHFASFMIHCQVNDTLTKQGRQFWAKDNEHCITPSLRMPTDAEVQTASDANGQDNERRLKNYTELIEDLVGLANSNHLHWRHKTMALSFLSLQVRPDQRMTASAVKLLSEQLLSDAVKDRKLAIGFLSAVLKTQKRPSKRVDLSIKTKGGWGYRADNDCLQYRVETVPNTQEAWDKTHFVDKTHWGFYCWPKILHVRAPYSQQPQLNRDDSDLDEAEKVIQRCFKDESYVKKLCVLLSLESGKKAADSTDIDDDDEDDDNDEFHPFTYNFFKRLSENYGDVVLQHFLPAMEIFSKSSKIADQKFLAEFLAGVVQGSKRWGFEMVQRMWKWAIPLFRSALDNITSETKSNWGTCIATIFDSRDPRRLHPLIQLLFEEAEKTNESTFATATKLYLLQGGLNQCEWRVIESLRRVEKLSLVQVAQPYQNVRSRLGSCLSTVYWYSMDGMVVEALTPPQPDGLYEMVLRKIDLMMQEKLAYYEQNGANGSKTNGEPKASDKTAHKEAQLVLKTFLGYLDNHWTFHADSLPPSIMQFFPVLCYLANDTGDDELKGQCQNALLWMAIAEVRPDHLPILMDLCEQVSKAKWWKARLSVLAYLQVHVISNLFNYRPDLVKRLFSLFMTMLMDEQVEVQSAASESLSGFLQCKLISFDENLHTSFEQVASEKSTSVNLRHGGVLGLAAIVGASPYSVPPALINALMALSKHAHDPQPIMRTVKKTLQEFKRTHQDSWHEHKQLFTDDQLAVLTDLLVSPNYYV